MSVCMYKISLNNNHICVLVMYQVFLNEGRGIKGDNVCCMLSMVPVSIPQGTLSPCSLFFHMVAQPFTTKAGGVMRDVGKEGGRLLQGSSAQGGLTCSGPKSPAEALDIAAERAAHQLPCFYLSQPAQGLPWWAMDPSLGAAMEALGKRGIHT